MSLMFFMTGVAIAMSCMTLAMMIVFIKSIIIRFGKIELECRQVVIEAQGNLRMASEINQTLASKIEIIEDALKVLDFYRNQGKK